MLFNRYSSLNDVGHSVYNYSELQCALPPSLFFAYNLKRVLRIYREITTKINLKKGFAVNQKECEGNTKKRKCSVICVVYDVGYPTHYASFSQPTLALKHLTLALHIGMNSLDDRVVGTEHYIVKGGVPALS